MAARRKLARALKSLIDPLAGWATVGALWLLRRVDRRKMANVLGPMMRRIGPWFPEHKLGRANLVAAFPEKSPEEIEKILGSVWDNLGRVAAEFAHIDRFTIHNPEAPSETDVDITFGEETYHRFKAFHADGRARLFFAAHLGNWELPALGPQRFGLASSVLYRRPNIGRAGDAIIALRERCMGNMIAAGIDAPLKLGRALQRGDQVGMLVDQHTTQGVDVMFFGRKARTSTLIAQLARLTGAPIHGVRVVRQADGYRFWGEITDEVAPVRDADGNLDIQGTTQAVASVVESWVRQSPEQWLWLHRRWR